MMIFKTNLIYAQRTKYRATFLVYFFVLILLNYLILKNDINRCALRWNVYQNQLYICMWYK